MGRSFVKHISSFTSYKFSKSSYVLGGLAIFSLSTMFTKKAFKKSGVSVLEISMFVSGSKIFELIFLS